MDIIKNTGVKATILFAETNGDRANKKKTSLRIYNWPQALEIGSKIENEVIFNRIRNQQPGMCCNLVYTSGTTGDPKGVMLSHDNMTWYWSVKNKILEYHGEDKT